MMAGPVSRRRFLQTSAAIGARASAIGAVGLVAMPKGSSASAATSDPFPWSEATIADLQAAMESGETTARRIIVDHIERIELLDWAGPRVNSMIEVNPDAEAIADALDRERAGGHVRGPLHGVPIVVKDCVATDDRMETTAGSLALVGARAPRDAGVVAKLREAGAVLLGKANMSEWNAFRGWPLHGGWSARAGMGRNPYDLSRSTGDSSSGSAAAVAASFAAGAVGLETYGSIVMPSSLCGVVGLKPTHGLVSRSGSIGIAHSRDVLGPMARTVADVAALLGGMAGRDPLDPYTEASEGHVPADYRRFLDPDGLRGARIGVWRRRDLWKHEDVATVIEDALDALEDAGARLVDPVDLPAWKDATGEHIGVMFTEFRHDIRDYLSGLANTSIRTLADVVAFNEGHHDEELRWHSQNTLESALEQPSLSDPGYRRSLRLSRRLGREAFDRPMREHRLDAIVAPTFLRAWVIDLRGGDDPMNGNGAAGPSNAAGYPHITVPAGFAGGLPIGISFMARAWQEPKLLRYAYAFEHATQARRAPRFVELPFVDR
jgi:amidase